MSRKRFMAIFRINLPPAGGWVAGRYSCADVIRSRNSTPSQTVSAAAREVSASSWLYCNRRREKVGSPGQQR